MIIAANNNIIEIHLINSYMLMLSLCYYYVLGHTNVFKHW